MTDPESVDRKSVPLTTQQWAALNRVAEETGSIATSGPSTGQPSWRALLRRIAEGELMVKKTEEE